MRSDTGQADPRALEARTQAIGRELFAAARREHAHLSALNRWTAQVLSWCLADPSVKGAVLRFIDVLPSLESPRAIARHLRDYFPTSDLRLPATLRLGSQLARSGLLTHGAVAGVIRQLVEQVARQFIAQSQPDAVEAVMHALALRRATCSLDLLGEQVLSEPEADRYAAQCRAVLRDAARACAALPSARRPLTCGPQVNLSVKPSALSPRFDPISPSASMERAAQRLLPLMDDAAGCGALITLDMEQYELRDLTLSLARRVLVHLPAPPVGGAQAGAKRDTGASLGVVIQAYLRDAQESVEELLAWLAAHERLLTVRLVKGAYWDYEVAQALQAHWPVPVHQQKSATDLAFERLTQRLLAAHPLVTTAVASHNVRSIAHAMAAAELLGLAKDRLEFQLLYGMGDALQAAIVARGYPVRIYTPIGELIPGMAYLVRRLLENTANESFLRQDLLQERSPEELLAPPAVRPEPAAQPATAWSGQPLTDFSRAESRAAMTEALTSVRGRLGQHYPLWIGEEAVETSATLVVRNPALPAQVIGLVAKAGVTEVDRTVAHAASAQPAWAQTPVEERVACLRRAAESLRRQRHALAAWEVLEVGKTWREADAEVVETIDYLAYYGERMAELAAGRRLAEWPGERNLYRYLPRGVAVVIAPWNFPTALLTGMAAAAVVSGHAVILKPAEQSSVTAALVARALRDCGIPPAIVQFLPGPGAEVGAALVQHPGVHTVLFTGSKSVGLSIIEACGRVRPGQRFVKHAVTEMGGKNAILVDDDADLDAAVAGIVRSAFGYAGQKCSAASRLIAHEAVYDALLTRLTAATDRLVLGDPADPATDVGPLIDAAAQRRLREAVEWARQHGRLAYEYPAARLPAQGHFVGPVIATELSPTDRLAREELFGPLLCVFRARSFEDALVMANDTDYALTGGVYSRSPSHIDRAMRLYDVGNLYINRPITGAMVGRQPFGGHRLSGLGTKAGGPDYLLQLMLPKTICINTARHGMPLE